MQVFFCLFVFLLYHPFLPFSHVVIHCGRLADSPLGGPRGLRSVIVAGFVGCCPRCCGPTLSAEALSKDLTSSHLTRSVSHTHVQDKESTQPAPVHESRCVSHCHYLNVITWLCFAFGSQSLHVLTACIQTCITDMLIKWPYFSRLPVPS